jgi:hypothetical protein
MLEYHIPSKTTSNGVLSISTGDLKAFRLSEIWDVYTSLHCSASSSSGDCPNSSSIQRNFQDFPGGKSVRVPGFQRSSFDRALPKDQL